MPARPFPVRGDEGLTAACIGFGKRHRSTRSIKPALTFLSAVTWSNWCLFGMSSSDSDLHGLQASALAVLNDNPEGVLLVLNGMNEVKSGLIRDERGWRRHCSHRIVLMDKLTMLNPMQALRKQDPVLQKLEVVSQLAALCDGRIR